MSTPRAIMVSRDLDHIRRHALHQRRIVGDEPEEPGIAEVLEAARLAIGFGSEDALAQQARLGVDQPAQARGVALLQGLHGRAEGRVAIRVRSSSATISALSAALPRFADPSALPALAIGLPFERIADDQPFDQRQRPARGRGMQRRLAGRVVARVRTGGEQRIDDREAGLGRSPCGAGVPKRRATIVRLAFGPAPSASRRRTAATSPDRAAALKRRAAARQLRPAA